MYEIYIVKDGDTLDSIAKMYGTTSNALNNINGDITDLGVGSSIIVPRRSNLYFDNYSIKKGDSLYKIAEFYNTPASLLADINGLNLNDYIYPGDLILVPKKGVSVYITANGDTLDKVYQGMNANLSKFLEQNSRLYLYPGQLIVYKEEN